MIRILHMIGSLDIGGSQAMVMSLYRKIDRSKIQFDFIVDHPDQLYFADEVKTLGGKIFFLPTFKGKNIFEVKKAWNKLFDEHPEYKILHSHVRSYASIYLPIAKKYGLKTIIHSHSTSNGAGCSAIIKTIMQYPLRFQADYFFGCSKEAGEWLFGKKRVNNKNYYMLQNAIDTSKYKLIADIRQKYRDEFGIDNDMTLFLHVGRLHEAKNHIFLLKLFSELITVKPDSMLVIVGDGELRAPIEQEIKALTLSNNVILLGARNDVPNIMMAADCFLFPSTWEGLPVTVVEAQASGLPCFVSDTVTRDVNVSKLVQNIPIDQGTTVWVDHILKCTFERSDVTDQIEAAGFDISSSAKWITEFYRGLVK